MARGMEKVSCFITMAESIKGNGNVISNMGKAMRSFKMDLSTRDFSSMVNLKD